VKVDSVLYLYLFLFFISNIKTIYNKRNSAFFLLPDPLLSAEQMLPESRCCHILSTLGNQLWQLTYFCKVAVILMAKDYKPLCL